MLTHRHHTIIGDIPEDWQPKPLRTLLEKQFSGDWGSDEGEQAVSVLRSTNFTISGALDFSDVATRYFSPDKAANFGLIKGDLLVERSGGGPDQPVGRIGFITEDIPAGTVSNFVQVLQPNPEEVNPEFLGWVLYELQRTGIIERVQQQSTQMRNLNWRDYQRLLLPWPELDEQRRIAAALKLADDAIAKAKAELEATRELKRSLMQMLFVSGMPGRHSEFVETKIGRIPKGWQVKCVKDVLIDKPINGYSPQSNPEPPGTKTLNVACIRHGECAIAKATYVDIDISVIESLQVKTGDFFVLRGNGNRDYIGIGGVVRDDIQESMIYSDLLFRLRFQDAETVPFYIPYMWQTQTFLHRLQSKAKSGSGLWKIGKRDIENELFVLPGKDEQRDIVEVIDAVINSFVATEKTFEVLQQVKKSLLQNLLTGKIRIPEGAIHG